jgi:PKD repeat protein
MTDKYVKSPFGESKYPYITSPDTQYNSEGIYHVKLLVDKEKAQSDIKKINEVISKELAEEHKRKPNKTSPMKRAPLPYKETEDGKIEFHFKTKFKPKLVDKNAKPIDSETQIWGGSIMSINYEPVGYNTSIGIGCSLRMASAQVSKIVQGSSALEGFTPVNENGESLV